MRTVIVSLATAGALCAIATPARADQCAWLDDDAVVDRASRELARAVKVIEYCEPCGDPAPALSTTKAPALGLSRLNHTASALAVYAS